jgi:hypothetical protein
MGRKGSVAMNSWRERWDEFIPSKGGYCDREVVFNAGNLKEALPS